MDKLSVVTGNNQIHSSKSIKSIKSNRSNKTNINILSKIHTIKE